MFLSLDGTLVVQLINFAIFFALLNVVFLRPVAAAIAKRRDYINGLVSDYDRYQAEAQDLRAQAEDIRAAARRKAEQHVAAARAAASNEAAELSTRYARAGTASVVEDAQRDRRRRSSTRRARRRERRCDQLADFMLDRVIPEAAK